MVSSKAVTEAAGQVELTETTEGYPTSYREEYSTSHTPSEDPPVNSSSTDSTDDFFFPEVKMEEEPEETRETTTDDQEPFAVETTTEEPQGEPTTGRPAHLEEHSPGHRRQQSLLVFQELFSVMKIKRNGVMMSCICTRDQEAILEPQEIFSVEVRSPTDHTTGKAPVGLRELPVQPKEQELTTTRMSTSTPHVTTEQYEEPSTRHPTSEGSRIPVHLLGVLCGSGFIQFIGGWLAH